MAMTSGAAANPGPGAQGAQAGRSHLVAGTTIVGNITAPGLLEIQGRIEGRVMADSVVVEERGTVEGEIQAAAIGVRGHFNGHLSGGAVRIHATARISGTIRYESLTIESGSEITASFERAKSRA
jgi:cytoskeletal protein CcmA (bactofilin family)